jgi:hypothetical protein
MPAELATEQVSGLGASSGGHESPPADSHPDSYSIPGITPERTAEAAPAGEPAPVATPAPNAQPIAAAAPAAAAPPAKPGEVGGTPAAHPSAGEPGSETIPKYRLDETIQQRDQATSAVRIQHDIITEQRQQIATMQAMVNRLMNGEQPVPGAPAAVTPTKTPLSEGDQKIVDRFYQLFPQMREIEKLLPHTESLLKVTSEVVPQLQQSTKAHWERVSNHMYGLVDDGVAKVMLGDGKTGKDLTPESQQRFRNDFYIWLQQDRGRQQRYANLDASLVSDFASELEHTYVAPVRQRYGASVTQRAAAAVALPTGGGGAAPVVAKPPSAHNPKDEEGTHNEAWSRVVQMRQTA